MTATIENRTHIKLSPELLDALERRNSQLRFSSFEHVFYVVWLYAEKLVGVAGDGNNACYEWFVWDGEKLTTSDCGYGSTSVALRDVLISEGGF